MQRAAVLPGRRTHGLVDAHDSSGWRDLLDLQTTPQTDLCSYRNLAPLCRRHHRAKQAPSWHLTQDQPGHMTWRLPSGREYQTRGDPYLQ
jgi:hypothetical protein